LALFFGKTKLTAHAVASLQLPTDIDGASAIGPQGSDRQTPKPDGFLNERAAAGVLAEQTLDFVLNQNGRDNAWKISRIKPPSSYSSSSRRVTRAIHNAATPNASKASAYLAEGGCPAAYRRSKPTSLLCVSLFEDSLPGNIPDEASGNKVT
jgi:hypothetical protein